MSGQVKSALKFLMHYGMVTHKCADNCSGHGECQNGTCFCEIQFIGDECRLTNTSYFVVFATIFFAVAFVCFVQLIMCIVAEWNRLKSPSLLRACRITTQKVLYFIVFLASVIRGTYFTSPNAFEEWWSRGLMSAYYPLLLSGSSLIICFWAEVFHLRDLRWEHRQFLSKSFLGFIAFNVISYSLFLAEFLTVHFLKHDDQMKSIYALIFNCCYAVLLFINVVFFLIYGVEVFFKVRGGFLLDETGSGQQAPEEATQLFKAESKKERIAKAVDTSQLHQSRLGLLSQALMLMAMVFFLCFETLGQLYWKDKVPISSRNVLNLLFRSAEIGVALWFPCVLWNCVRPEQLWILNPKRLLKNRDYDISKEATKDSTFAEKMSLSGSEDGGAECWICYDNTRVDAGPLITPCNCKGDVKLVHHNCLRKWLMESDIIACSVCQTDYCIVTPDRVDLKSIASATAWRHTLATVSLVGCCLIGVSLTVNLITDSLTKLITVGTCLLVLYICLKFLCERQIHAYNKARASRIKIQNLSTISSSLTQHKNISTL
ncbi:hypothetical protein O3M35_005800 [Rhynocoris fuscipes]|uniref:Uncharacterized protein n=1 Tax=Rhynocoris fuscipes TaxID=488301 RepID=A0AAW1DKS8_9HEMI